MELVFENTSLKNPLVSIVLLDWSVRESYHVLDYLNNQTIQREQYEIIWIEYYDKRPREIETKLKECIDSGKPPIVDKWIVMEMPHNVYYHKHLMYNVGIVVSRGSIVTFMDSDAVVRPTFVESIIKSFKKDCNIVLHMDQVRNMDRKFYPFNYPSIDEITKEGCVNLVNGKPRGLVDKSDPLHTRNYGACMSALRDDLISIGGADEHINYLGHICGPYEMTFRLVNAGKREIWHRDEWLYHTWHPGQAGDRNYAGPHDGRHMSQTALSARRTGRILSLVENPAIRELRLKNEVSSVSLLSMAVSETDITQYMIDCQAYNEVRYSVGSTSINMKVRDKNNHNLNLSSNLKLKIFIGIIIRHLRRIIPLIKETMKGFLGLGIRKDDTESCTVATNPSIQANGVRDFIRLGLNFGRYLLWWNNYVIDRCRQCLHDLTTIGVREVAVFGTGDVAQALCLISKPIPIRIAEIYDSPIKRKRFMGYKVLPLEEIKNYRGKVIIGSFENVMEKTEMLKKMVINDKMIVDLW